MIVGNAWQQKVLKRAGVRVASALIVGPEDDVANLSIALIAQEPNPSIRVVLRMSDAQPSEDIR